MKEELPFDVTPTTLRYLRELMDFFDNFFVGAVQANPQGPAYRLDRYKKGETTTHKTEININDFWSHLESLGAVSVEYPDKKDFVALNYSNVDEFMLFPQYCWVHILKADPVRELLEFAEKQIKEKTTKSKVVWDSMTSTLTYRDIRHKFQQHEKKDAPKLQVFTELWKERRSKENKGIPLEVKALSARVELVADRREDSFSELAETQIHQLVKDIGTVLKKKGFPIRIRRVSNSYQLEVVE